MFAFRRRLRGGEGEEESGCNVDGVDKTIPTIAVVLPAEARSVVWLFPKSDVGIRSAVVASEPTVPDSKVVDVGKTNPTDERGSA